MSKKSGSFGQPKPLPGQAGYKVAASDILEKESSEMEIRLRMLQVVDHCIHKYETTSSLIFRYTRIKFGSNKS